MEAIERTILSNQLVWGTYQINTPSEACISAINSYYHQVLGYGRDVRVILEAPAHDPNCVLGNTLAAYFLSSSHLSHALLFIAAAKAQLEHASRYERAVFDVISYWIRADRDDDVAIDLHAKLLRDFPRDLVSLKRAHGLCFLMGRADLSLKLVQQVLAENEEENYIYGMLAFPLVELGRLEEAKEAALKGYQINENDGWVHHALCHVLQHECRFKEAVYFMEKCSPSWDSQTALRFTHNWWHVAVCYLEGNGPIKKVVEIYDHCIGKELERSDPTSYEEVQLNAVGLLLRVFVRGRIDVFGDRVNLLATYLMHPVYWHIEFHLDVLILWILAYTGEHAKGEDLLRSLKYRISKMGKKKQQSMQCGILLAEAMYEYGNGKYKRAMELLGTDFNAMNCKIIGASNAELEVFDEAWCSLLLKTGQPKRAIESIKRKIKNREGAPFLWRLLEKGHMMVGREDEATRASEKAAALENAHFS